MPREINVPAVRKLCLVTITSVRARVLRTSGFALRAVAALELRRDDFAFKIEHHQNTYGTRLHAGRGCFSISY